MNEDLNLLFNWLCANRLSLNVTKTLRLNGKVLF